MAHQHRGGWFPTFCLVVAGAVAPGCSHGDGLPREPVSGLVTLDGQPLDQGAIQFSPAVETRAGTAVSGGAVIDGGRFSIDREHGLVPGSYKVGVNAAAGEPARTGSEGPGGKPLARPRERIPAKYNGETILTAEVKKGGPNQFRYDLQSK
jgi:hypothetical protein